MKKLIYTYFAFAIIAFQSCKIHPSKKTLLSEAIVTCPEKPYSVNVSLIKDLSSLESRSDYPLLSDSFKKIDFTTQDLVVVTPADLQLLYQQPDIITTTGNEWMAYTKIKIFCKTKEKYVDNMINMQCEPYLGKAGAYYYQIIKKTDKDSAKCSCSDLFWKMEW